MHVYCITNTVNGKIYIGQHSGDDLQAYLRMNCRYAETNAPHKPYLYRAIRKYGRESFVIKSLVQPIDRQQMDALEMFFIRTLGTRNSDIGYNLTDGGDGVKSGPFTDEHRAKLSAARKGKIPWNKGKKGTYYLWPNGRIGTMTGKHHSEETKEKMSLSQKSRSYGPISPEWRENIRLAGIRNWENAEYRERVSAAQKRGKAMAKQRSEGGA
jgi:group I intron endonuclease